MKLIDLLVQELPKRGGWPIDSDDERTLTATLPSICWGLDNGGYYAFRGPCDRVSHQLYEETLLSIKSGWNAEGFPPVGCECEFNACDRGWEKCTVMYASKYTVILHTVRDGDPEEAFTPEDLEFRPIRSEADKKRDEYVQAMIDFDKRVFGSLETHHKAVYDAIAAGKIPGVRLE